jgi:biopolymer transport protein ExbB/biopolymer transport protein TolQ
LSEAAYYGVGAIAGGLAEALVTTAFGLVLAVPVTWLFKYFTGKVDKFILEIDNSSAELIDFFLKQRDRVEEAGLRSDPQKSSTKSHEEPRR